MSVTPLFRQGLFSPSLFRVGLFRTPQDLGISFDDLLNLSQPMIVAYEGNDPEETGRYPQEGWCVQTNGTDQSVEFPDTLITDATNFKVVADWSNTTAGSFHRTGTFGNGAGNRMYFERGTDVIIAVVGAGSNITSIPYTTGWIELEMFGNGDVYANGLFVGNNGGIANDNNATFSLGKDGTGKYSPLTAGYAEVNGVVYNLDQSSGTTALASSTDRSLDGTLINGATWVTDVNLPYQYDALNEDGFNVGDGANGAAVGVIIPIDPLTPTQDVLGNAVGEAFQGSVYPVQPVRENSYATDWTGTTDYLSLPHLTGSETVVSVEGTSTPTISAGRIDFTAGTSSSLVLSDGTVLTMAEGVGDTLHDSSSNKAHATIVNGDTSVEGAGTWAGRIDGKANARNMVDGFSMYSDGANNLRVPYASGVPLVITPPAGFTFVSEHPPITHVGGQIGHNGAETTEDAYNITEAGNPTPASINLVNFSEITFDQTREDLAAIAPTFTAFRRTITSDDYPDFRDRLIVYYDTIDDTAEIDLIAEYTDPADDSGGVGSFRYSLSFDDGRNSHYLPLV